MHGMNGKNHCDELHVPVSEYKAFWAAEGNWKFPSFKKGMCQAPFTTKDSVTHDAKFKSVYVIKKGIALADAALHVATPPFCKKDSDCEGAGNYCMNDPTKHPPY